MTQEEHDRLMHEFVGYLKRSGITEFGIEHPIRLDDKNVGFVDVIVWAWDHAFLFDVKSDSKDLSNDVQKMRRYAYALRDTRGYRGTTIHMILIYDAKLRDRISPVGNLFDLVRPWFMDERNVPSDIDGRAIDFKQIIPRYRGRFPRLRGFLRDMADSGAVSQ